jgi:TonB family protein
MRPHFGIVFGAVLAASAGALPLRAQAAHQPTAAEASGRNAVSAPPADSSGGDGEFDEPYRWLDVDRVARPIEEARIEYPPMLRRQRVEGEAVAEFVVDTLGRVDPKSLRIVSATHALFANAARAALPRARYAPAELEGRKVRQIVVMPVRFVQPQ